MKTRVVPSAVNRLHINVKIFFFFKRTADSLVSRKNSSSRIWLRLYCFDFQFDFILGRWRVTAERAKPVAAENRVQTLNSNDGKQRQTFKPLRCSLKQRACLGNIWRVGTWQERWNNLAHLWQRSSSPPAWQTAHKTLSSNGSWCCTTCCCPSTGQMWCATSL